MKKLLLDVDCISDFDEAPDYFLIELTDSLIAKIKKLAATVVELDAYSIDFFDYSGEYFSDATLEKLTEENGIALADLTESDIANVNDDAGRMELNCVVVSKDSFKFTAVPKHLGDSESCYTCCVWLSELEKAEPTITSTLVA